VPPLARIASSVARHVSSTPASLPCTSTSSVGAAASPSCRTRSIAATVAASRNSIAATSTPAPISVGRRARRRDRVGKHEAAAPPRDGHAGERERQLGDDPSVPSDPISSPSRW
jgi:hypothetical protein